MKTKISIKAAAILLTAAILVADLYDSGSLAYAGQLPAQDQETQELEEKDTTEDLLDNQEVSNSETPKDEDAEADSQVPEDNEGLSDSEDNQDKEDSPGGKESSDDGDLLDDKAPEDNGEIFNGENDPDQEKTLDDGEVKVKKQIEEEQAEKKELENDKETGLLGELTPNQGNTAEVSPAEAFAELLKDYDMYGTLTNGTEVSIYKDASQEAAVVKNLSSGYQVKLTGVVLTENGVWFQIEFAVDDVVTQGYVQSDYVVSQDARLSEWKAQYLNSAEYQGLNRVNAVGNTDLSAFPKSYRSYIQTMLKSHPNWTFVPMNTGLSWAEVLKNEMENGRNLVDVNHPVTWKSTAPEDYNASTGQWVIKNGTTWVQASEAIVKYYLDPRNFLNETSVFQFEQLTYNSAYHTESGVERILTGTFMSHKKLEDGSGGGITYAKAFMKIGKELKVSPYFLASRIRQEQGVNGTSPLISGTYPGYEGYYNYFNISATGTGNQVIISGLNEAKKSGWNTRYKALYGGAQKVSDNYITKGQDTFYLQKFDVDGSYNGLYWHQYMQNLLAADNEGKSVQSSYASMGILNNNYVFKVPVYNNMPSSACPKPAESLSKPSLAVTKNGYTSAKLSWKEIAGAQGYQVYRAEGTNGTYKKLKTISGAGNTAYEDKTVVPGKSYSYKVRAYLKLKEGNKYSSYSSVKTVDYTIPKTAWKSLTVKNYTTVELSWKKASVTGYKIYRKTDSGKYACIKTIKGSSNITYTDNTVLPGHTYSYKIRGYNTVSGKNYYSGYTGVKTAKVKMTAPQLNKAAVSGGSKVSLTWKRDKKATGYYVYRATSEKGKYKKIKTIKSNKTVSWSDSSISTGVTYYYKIRSYVKSSSGTANSSYSRLLMVKTKLAKPAVTSVTASAGGIKLKWKKSSNAGGYRIYRATSYSGKYKQVKKITKNSTVNWTDKNVTLGKTYYYKIRAYAVTGGKTKYSAYSTIVCAQPEISATQFTEISGISTSKVTMKWEKLSDVDGYKLYRKTGKSGKYKVVKTISKASTIKYTNSKLKRGTTYYYKIRAYKKVNGKVKYSDYSDAWCVQTK